MDARYPVIVAESTGLGPLTMNNRHQKAHNQAAILDVLRLNPPISQAEIADYLDLQPSTVSNLMKDLRSAGLVKQEAKKPAGVTGGKKADLLAPEPEHGFFGGLYLQGNLLSGRLMDFAERVVHEDKNELPSIDGGAIKDASASMIEAFAGNYKPYRGTGIAVSSVVSYDGEIRASSHFNVSTTDFAASLQAWFPDACLVVENDANTIAYYDFVKHRHDTLVHLLVRENPFTIGAGLVLHGAVYKGDTAAAGEIAEDVLHTTTHVDDVVAVARLLCAFLDLNTFFLSAPSGSTICDEIIRQSESKGLHARYAGSNQKAMNGAAMLASRAYTSRLFPISRQKRRP